MSFKNLYIKPEYRSLLNDVAKEFLIPTLNEGVCYDRAVGFFSSSVLSNISISLTVNPWACNTFKSSGFSPQTA